MLTWAVSVAIIVALLVYLVINDGVASLVAMGPITALFGTAPAWWRLAQHADSLAGRGSAPRSKPTRQARGRCSNSARTSEAPADRFDARSSTWRWTRTPTTFTAGDHERDHSADGVFADAWALWPGLWGNSTE